MAKQRIRMTPKDLAQLSDCHERTAQRKWPDVLKFLNKEKHHIVTAHDLALFLNIPVEVVIETLFGKG